MVQASGGWLKPGCLVSRSHVGIGTLLLLREPRSKGDIWDDKESSTGTLRSGDTGLVISVHGDWIFVMSHDGMGWCKYTMLDRVVGVED